MTYKPPNFNDRLILIVAFSVKDAHAYAQKQGLTSGQFRCVHKAEHLVGLMSCRVVFLHGAQYRSGYEEIVKQIKISEQFHGFIVEWEPKGEETPVRNSLT